LAQADVIRKVAAEGPCVIVGRCADYVLKDHPNVINVFITAGLPFRVKRAIEIEGISEVKAEENVIKTDKRRANYYNYHASSKWGKADNYNICIQSDMVGIDGTVECIKTFVEQVK